MSSDNTELVDILIALLIIIISVSIFALTWNNMFAVPVGMISGAAVSILVIWIHYKIDIRRMRK